MQYVQMGAAAAAAAVAMGHPPPPQMAMAPPQQMTMAQSMQQLAQQQMFQMPPPSQSGAPYMHMQPQDAEPEKKRKAEYDGSAKPRRAQSALNFFSVFARKAVKKQSPEIGEEDLKAAVLQAWGMAGPDERRKCEEREAADKARFDEQTRVYNEMNPEQPKPPKQPPRPWRAWAARPARARRHSS